MIPSTEAVCHGPNNYKDTKPLMSSLLVVMEFIDWRYSQRVGIFDPSCELTPLQPSHWFTSPLPPPFPVLISTSVMYLSMVGKVTVFVNG